MLPPAAVLAEMQSRISAWEAASDDRALFLNCYRLMTSHMLGVIEQQGFHDTPWVDRLLKHFADYYFVALEAYERDRASAPAVWQRAHDAAQRAEVTALQKLLLGINAHINYDLVLAVVDMLQPEWRALTESQRAERYADYLHVNDVIGQTIDAVQDQVLAPEMPILKLFDELLGRMDETLISHLIAYWRDATWAHAMKFLAAEDAQERARLTHKIEQESLRTAELIGLGAPSKA
jgi:hypothetical protein